MTNSELKRLLSDLEADPVLQAEFILLRRNDPAAAVRLMASKGYWLSRQDAEELMRSFDELSDDELDMAAGGAWNDPPPPGSGG